MIGVTRLPLLTKPVFGRLYMYLRLLNAARLDREIRRAVVMLQFDRGYCPICDKKAIFVRRNQWLRDNYFCVGCFSIPRQRAIIHILNTQFPDWRELCIHESSSGGQSSVKIKQECRWYSSSQYLPDIPAGEVKDGIQSENLEKMTFADDSFDLFITQDVFEHVLHPDAAFLEVTRVLKPGGAHVFTVPYHPSMATVVRAVEGPEGITHLESPDYHGSPDEGAGWLVVTDWGPELIDFIRENGGMRTTVFGDSNRELGLEADFLEVFVSRKES